MAAEGKSGDSIIVRVWGNMNTKGAFPLQLFNNWSDEVTYEIGRPMRAS